MPRRHASLEPSLQRLEQVDHLGDDAELSFRLELERLVDAGEEVREVEEDSRNGRAARAGILRRHVERHEDFEPAPLPFESARGRSGGGLVYLPVMRE